MDLNVPFDIHWALKLISIIPRKLISPQQYRYQVFIARFGLILLGLGLPIQRTNGCKSFLGYKEGTLVSFIDETNQYRYEIKNGIRDEYEDRTCMFFLL